MNDRTAAVARQVAARVPVDGREARSRHRILVALGRLAQPFDEDSDLTHLTGSAVVLGPKGVLLHRHKRLGIWLQPGGHIEAGEAASEAGRREAREETGLQLELVDPPSLLHVDVHQAAKGHTHLDLRYLLTVVGDDTPRPPVGESQAVRWFDWDEALEIADPGLRGLLAHLHARRFTSSGAGGS